MTKRTAKIPERKSASVSGLTDLLSKAKAVAVVDYTKMTPVQATALRRDIRAAGGEMKVTKNTLFSVALQNSQFTIHNLQLAGLNAFIFALTDEVSPLKAVAEFIKKNNVLAFRSGFMGDKVLTATEVETLAKTPNREISVAKLLYLLNYSTSHLARTLDAIAKR